MPKTKKKFIDRKKAVTFNLVHRSQRDPLAADETAPQRVLVPVNVDIPQKKNKEPELTTEQRREEQKKYGIYFDDDYNYLQHLKDTREVTLVVQPKPVHKRKEKAATVEGEPPLIPVTESLTLPSSVFASEVEEDIGLLNKAAPQGLRLDLDPEVVAALDEDFDFDDPENQLEDNFIEMAMADGDDDEDDDYDGDSMSNDDDSDEAFASDQDSDDESDSQNGRPGKGGRMPSWEAGDKDDTKSRFTQYSMSSSVIRRNEGLTLLDRKFEQMMAEYDDTEIGALDHEEIEGHLPATHHMVLQAAEEFEESKRRYQLDKDEDIVRMLQLRAIAEESDEDVVVVKVKPEKKWDCQTILSTYSNLHNHPKIIEEPKKPRKIILSAKTGLPKDTLGKDNKLTTKSVAKFNAMQRETGSCGSEDGSTSSNSDLTTLSKLSIRPKDESAEAKKERKRLLKEHRRERRIEKKANKLAFKEEKKRQVKIMMNDRNNVQGNRIV